MYASVLVLITLVKGPVTLEKELVTLMKVLVTMGETIGDYFGSMYDYIQSLSANGEYLGVKDFKDGCFL